MSCDPIGERGGLNLYGMVNNDSVGRWDYLGLELSKQQIVNGILDFLQGGGYLGTEFRSSAIAYAFHNNTKFQQALSGGNKSIMQDWVKSISQVKTKKYIKSAVDIAIKVGDKAVSALPVGKGIKTGYAIVKTLIETGLGADPTKQAVSFLVGKAEGALFNEFFGESVIAGIVKDATSEFGLSVGGTIVDKTNQKLLESYGYQVDQKILKNVKYMISKQRQPKLFGLYCVDQKLGVDAVYNTKNNHVVAVITHDSPKIELIISYEATKVGGIDEDNLKLHSLKIEKCK